MHRLACKNIPPRTSSIITVSCSRLAKLIGPGGGSTTRIGVQSHLVVGHGINTFDDINFTLTGPVLTLGPECRPNLNRGDVRASSVGDGGPFVLMASGPHRRARQCLPRNSL